jgi:hypothetical protein
MWHVWQRREYRVFMGKPEGRRSLVRPRYIWEDNIKTGWGDVHWMNLAHDRNK